MKLMRGAALAVAMMASQPAAAAPPALADELLRLHNDERAELDLAPLAWDDRLAADAAAYAHRLAARRSPLVHSLSSERPNQGENLWMGTRGFFSPAAMFGFWSGEKRYYRPGVFPDIAHGVPWQTVGHYTQIVWRDTQRVGCAIAPSAGADYLVCRYWPAGNVRGRPVA